MKYINKNTIKPFEMKEKVQQLIINQKDFTKISRKRDKRVKNNQTRTNK